MKYWKYQHFYIEISRYRWAGIKVSVAEISEPGAGSETGMQIKIAEQLYYIVWNDRKPIRGEHCRDT